jgi:hypothetical protein
MTFVEQNHKGKIKKRNKSQIKDWAK